MLLNLLNKILKGETALNTTMLTTITIYTPVTVCNQLFVNCMLLWSYSRDMCVLHTMLEGGYQTKLSIAFCKPCGISFPRRRSKSVTAVSKRLCLSAIRIDHDAS